MANTFLKPSVIVRTALGLLQREIVLPRTVWRFGQADFTGAKDDTITLRLPAVLTAREYEWRTRTAPIVIDDLTEIGVDVTLDKHPYSAVAVTDEQLTLDIVSFAEQVLNPQVRAVAEALENYIAAALQGGTYVNTVDLDLSADGDPFLTLLAARAALNKANVPMSERYVAMGADVEAAFLGSDRISKAQNAGDSIASSALQDATLGRVAGFTLLTSNALEADEAFAYHRTAVAFGNVAPAVPDGAQAGSSQTYQGLAMRWIRDYDPNFLRDRSVASSFAGVKLVTDDADGDGAADDVIRAVKIDFTPAGP